jgi:hypothetical protein
MEIIVRSDEGKVLYGHQLINIILESGFPEQFMVVEGITPEAYAAYLKVHFGDVKEVKALFDARS